MARLEEARETMIPDDEILPNPLEPDETEVTSLDPAILPLPEPSADRPNYGLTSEQKRLQAESHFPPDLQINWFWLHGLVFGAFILVSFVVMQIVVLLSLPPHQRTKAELAQEYLLSHPVLSIGSTVAIFALLLFFLYMTLSALPGKPFWRTLGWRKIEPRTARLPKNPILYFFLGGAVSLLVALLTTLLHAPDNTPIVQVFHHRNTALLFLAVAVLIAPLVEETLFRGYLYPLFVRIISAVLRGRGVEDDLALHKGIITSIALTGLLFGLMHGPQLGGALSLIAVMSLVGILFTLVRALTGSVLASFLMHLGYNSLISVVALISTRGFTKMPPGH
jgi:membrane protease YdiL (CAAX protease family)